MDRGSLRIWGGIEPSVVRVGDRYVDQVRRTGHHDRIADLDLLAGLGIEAVRYPVLWERVAPDGLASADWSWTDERLHRLERSGIEPIVTLLHHGSGPRYTDLLDPEFPAKFAQYARAVARRYPWVRRFTPINEPLTTARFSALYGHWYPHARDACAFVTALLNQVQGIARAMEAIREEIPHAQLVQTEDLGKVYATPELAYQAEFENARRWMSTDLLCGTFEMNAPARQWLRQLGRDLCAGDLRQYRCEPEILGFNYYVTGERFLDHRVERYPSCTPGGNGRDRYVDVEAVRVCREEIDGVFGLLGEAWQRYRRPLAITEAHIACTRDEQIRWLDEIYGDVLRLRAAGADVRALTVWALFGARDWNSLLTVCGDCYESGCFDAVDHSPRETLVAAWTRARASGLPFDHPVLESPGWWRTPQRLCYGAASRGVPQLLRRTPSAKRSVAIVGSSALAVHCAAACRLRSLRAIRMRADGAPTALARRLKTERAWLAIDADGGSRTLVARAARTAGVPLVVLSAATSDCLDVAETAAIMATGRPLIARYGGADDLESWIHRTLDLAIDGFAGFLTTSARAA